MLPVCTGRLTPPIEGGELKIKMSKQKILIADDEKDCCDSFKNYFAKRDFLVHTAYDGLKAKELLENNQYVYVFFDCNMPGLSGVELLRVIQEKNPESKKIMISGYELINKDFAQDLGVDIFLKKPISLEEVEKIIK